MHTIVRLLMIALFVAGGLGAVSASAEGEAGSGVGQATKGRFLDAPEDAPLASYRVRLLDVAMDAASKMPLNPHIKNRSRAQHAVAMAALRLDQPRLALGYMSRIDNWRKGVVSAEYMIYAARRGHTQNMDYYDRIAQASAKLSTQDWRREHIYVRLAQARLLMGNPAPAKQFNTQLTNPSYVGQTTQAEIETLDRDDEATYSRLVTALDSYIKQGHYEIIINSGQAYVDLYRKQYLNPSRRQAIETKLRKAYENMPGPETIDLLLGLADATIDNKDMDKALAFLGEAKGLYEKTGWNPGREYRSDYAARLAERYVRAGDADKARPILDAALAIYNEHEQRVFDIWRADCLRPLAGAYQSLGDTKPARSLYARALEAGGLNPNGRPQSEDLAATCTSMALYAFEPDKALWDEIDRLADQLSAPW